MMKLLCLILAVGAAGCGARQRIQAAPAPPGAAPTAVSAGESLSSFIEKVRTLAAEARPRHSAAATLEASDPLLAAAVVTAATLGTAASHRAAATEYRRVGILDQAHAHLRAAVTADPSDAEAWDALARLWRDWGLPHVGIGDAQRALYFAPNSAAARNTLGTLFQALGRRAEAREQYLRALQLEPDAAYALNNLCYGWILEGQVNKAVAACRRALGLQPTLAAARNNLGLAYAVGGDLDRARAAFSRLSGDRARALYNMGIVHLAQRRYREAMKAFDGALALRPASALVAARAQQALAQVNRGTHP